MIIIRRRHFIPHFLSKCGVVIVHVGLIGLYLRYFIYGTNEWSVSLRWPGCMPRTSCHTMQESLLWCCYHNDEIIPSVYPFGCELPWQDYSPVGRHWQPDMSSLWPMLGNERELSLITKRNLKINSFQKFSFKPVETRRSWGLFISLDWNGYRNSFTCLLISLSTFDRDQAEFFFFFF